MIGKILAAVAVAAVAACGPAQQPVRYSQWTVHGVHCERQWNAYSSETRCERMDVNP